LTISKEWRKSKVKGYAYVRLKRLGNDLRLDVLVDEKVENLVNEKILVGRIEQEIDESTEPPTIGRKHVHVTTETGELGTFFKNNDHDPLFKPSGFTFTKHIAR
jgi:hypothetical protein